MWSRRFLFTGVSIGAVIALLTIAATWLGLFAVPGSKDPAWTIANIVKFTLPGPIIYAACWYAHIFLPRDYSFRRTMVVVARTFATGCAVVAVILIAGAAIAISLRARHVMEAATLVAATPLTYGLMTLIGAIILVIPYAIVATPMALLHRWLMLRIFASSGSPTPSTGAIIPPPAPV